MSKNGCGRERVPEERQIGDVFGIDFEVESYLEAHANKFIGTFDANCYLYLSRAMDWYDLSDGYPDMKSAFEGMNIQSAKIIGVETDILWPPRQQSEICLGFSAHGVDCNPQMLPSRQGHDSFLVDFENFSPSVADYFNSIE